MQTNNVSIRDLQQLNDAIAYTMDAIQRISPQVQTGLTHTAYGQLPIGAAYVAPLAMDPFGVVRSGLDHTAYATRSPFGSPFLATSPFGQSAFGVSPFGANAFAANAFNGTMDPFTQSAIARGLLHSPFGTGATLANPLAATYGNPLAATYGTWGGVQYVPVRTW